MSALYSIAPDKLDRPIGTPACPMLIDVRIDEDFDGDPNRRGHKIRLGAKPRRSEQCDWSNY